MPIRVTYKELTDWPILPTNPGDIDEGYVYINSGDNTVRLYYGAKWTVLHTISMGLSFILLETGDILLLETGDKVALEV